MGDGALNEEFIAALRALGGEARGWNVKSLLSVDGHRISDRLLFDTMEALVQAGRVSRLRVEIAPPNWIYRLR